MTMHSSDQRQGGFVHSTSGQMIITIVVLVAAILFAWRYVF
jgi:predicted negative regulator of RcsB-dependent stress response